MRFIVAYMVILSSSCGDSSTDQRSEGLQSTSASVSASATETQMFSAEGEALSGVSIAFPPGSLSIDQTVVMEEGTNLASDIAAELGLEDAGVAASGASVVFTPGVDVDAIQPFTIQLPVTSTSLTATSSYVLLYKVKIAASGEWRVGVAAGADITFSDAKVSYETKYFGSFQLGTVTSPIVSKEAKTTVPVVKKSSTQAQFLGKWKTACEQKEGGYRQEFLTISASWAQSVQRIYDDVGCATTPTLQTTIVVGVSIGDKIESGQSFLTYALDLTFTRFKMKPLLASATQYLNAQRICGLSTWVTNEVQEVTGLGGNGCQAMDAGTKYYVVIGRDVQGRLNVSRMGNDAPADRDGSTAAMRSITFADADAFIAAD